MFNLCTDSTHSGVETSQLPGQPVCMPARPSSARILFDESHSQAWTIRPDVARAIQPSHPEDSSYAGAAAAAAARDFRVDVHASGELTAEVLRGTDVLVLAHPSEERWEHVV